MRFVVYDFIDSAWISPIELEEKMLEEMEESSVDLQECTRRETNDTNCLLIETQVSVRVIS